MKNNWLVCDGSGGHFCLRISAWSCLCLKFSRNTTHTNAQVSVRGEKSGLSSTWTWWNRDIVPWAERDALWWWLWCQSMQRCSDWWSRNPPTPLNHASIFHSWDCVCSVQFALLSLCFPAEWWWGEKHPSSSLQINWKKILEELMKHLFLLAYPSVGKVKQFNNSLTISFCCSPFSGYHQWGGGRRECRRSKVMVFEKLLWRSVISQIFPLLSLSVCQAILIIYVICKQLKGFPKEKTELGLSHIQESQFSGWVRHLLLPQIYVCSGSSCHPSLHTYVSSHFSIVIISKWQQI